jgi:hypothetical protein
MPKPTKPRGKGVKRNIEKMRHTQGCLTDSIAFFLNIHPQNVPFFVYPRKGWNERLKDFLEKHGYAARWDFATKPPKRGTHIVCGNSLHWKTAAHVVVYRNGKLRYDPTYPSKWDDKRITNRLIISPLPPKKGKK